MRGFKQILHLSGSIRLKLCNQAHVPLLKQELLGRFFRRNSAILIIYLKAMFPFFLCRVFVCFHPPCDCFLHYFHDDSTQCADFNRDYMTKR